MTRTNFERIGGLQKTLSADILFWRQNKMSRKRHCSNAEIKAVRCQIGPETPLQTEQNRIHKHQKFKCVFIQSAFQYDVCAPTACVIVGVCP